eukprot:PhM_4_TR18828/c0_g1_i2/m.95913
MYKNLLLKMRRRRCHHQSHGNGNALALFRMFRTEFLNFEKGHCNVDGGDDVHRFVAAAKNLSAQRLSDDDASPMLPPRRSDIYMSSFNLFVRDQYNKNGGDNNNVLFSSRTSKFVLKSLELRAKWHILPKEEKDAYREKAKEIRSNAKRRLEAVLEDEKIKRDLPHRRN